MGTIDNGAYLIFLLGAICGGVQQLLVPIRPCSASFGPLWPSLPYSVLIEFRDIYTVYIQNIGKYIIYKPNFLRNIQMLCCLMVRIWFGVVWCSVYYWCVMLLFVGVLVVVVLWVWYGTV